MLKRIIKMILRLAALFIILAVLVFGLPRLFAVLYAWPRLFDLEGVPQKRVVIVFGAGLYRDGRPTPVLRDRVFTASQLYFSGKAEKLLMSGDNSFVDYNEPAAMHDYALSLGVPDEAIVLDYAGRRTYDTCYRAQEIFDVSEAILVTQKFHLPRAIYTCNTLGVEAVGVSADRRAYSRGPYLFWNIREVLATLNAIWEVHFTRPLPVLGQFEPIFPDEAQ